MSKKTKSSPSKNQMPGKKGYFKPPPSSGVGRGCDECNGVGYHPQEAFGLCPFCSRVDVLETETSEVKAVKIGSTKQNI